MNSVSVTIICTNAELVKQITTYIQPDVGLTYVASNFDEASQSDSDLLLIDLAVPHATDELRWGALNTRHLTTPTVVFFAEDAPEKALRLAYAAGARGFVPHAALARSLRAAINKAMRQAFWFPEPQEDFLAKLQQSPSAANTPTTVLVEPLTEREREIVGLLAQGLKNKEIAAILCITEQSVKNRLRDVYGKLDISNRTQAVVRAKRLGLLDPS